MQEKILPIGTFFKHGFMEEKNDKQRKLLDVSDSTHCVHVSNMKHIEFQGVLLLKCFKCPVT